MNIVYIIADGISEFNSSNYRTCYISDALRQAGHRVDILHVRQWLDQTEELRYVLSRADICFVQRVLISESHDKLAYWRNRGLPIVVDIDDHYALIHDDNASAKFWLEGKVDVTLRGGFKYEKKLKEHPLDQFMKGLQYCTALTSPSYVLNEYWQDRLPCFVIPNYLKAEHYLNIPKEDNGGRIYLGWGGSLSHVQSFRDSGINDALRRVLQERDDVILYIFGDDRVVKQLPVRKDRVKYQNYVPFWDWPKVLARFDVGLAPLHGRYDDGRSDLKLREYLTFGIPFLASKSVVYKELYDCDSGIFVEHSNESDEEGYKRRVEDWYKSTIDMLDNLDYYAKRASGLIDFSVERFDASRNVDYVIGVYQKMIGLSSELS